MSRVTNYIVYVDAAIMNKPSELFDAVFAHFLKKDEEHRKKDVDSGVGIPERKKFMKQYMTAGSDKLKLKVIDDWIQVRDATTFPMRKISSTEEVEPGSEETPAEDKI